MPQDSLRSAVYRSFITCDDPKGVAECKTIRKSKKLEDSIKNHRKQQNSTTSGEKKDKSLKGPTEEYLQNRSSFQIMEVSKGAQKLNEVIDSISTGTTGFDNQSKYIAKDLLRGALDLQDSLSMLGKLQEASKYITKRPNKEKPQVTHFEKPRMSCSSKDCYDELREAIIENFARQNLLPKKEDYIDRKSSDFGVDFASSSSSSCCSSSKVHHEKPKGSNLIAKLMGLEEVPAKPVIYKRVDEKEKVLNMRNPLLGTGIDLPWPKKPQFLVPKVARERRTLEEIIETIQFKGLLERNSNDEYYDVLDSSSVRKDLAIEGPPIVIMRPRCVPDLRFREFDEDYWVDEEKPFKSRQMPRKTREEFPRGQLKLNEANIEKLRASKQKLNKESKSCGESHARMVKKRSDVQDRPSTTKTSHSKPLVPREQKKEAVVKKIDNIAKPVSNVKKQTEMKNAKSQGVGTITTLKLSKNERGSNISKASPDKHAKRTSLKSSNLKKDLHKDKSESKPSAASVENVQSDDLSAIKIESDVKESLIKSTISEEITEEVMNASSISISGSEASSPCESSWPTVEDNVKCIENVSCMPCHNLDKTKDGCKSITRTRYLLLSSASFLNLADELFDTRTCGPAVLPTDHLPDCEINLDASLLLECAKEILERKSLFCTRIMSPLSQNCLFKKPKCRLSLELLVVEICDGIEDLRLYSKSCGDIVSSMLERDLWWNGEVTGGWDLGWRNNGYTVEEVDELVHHVEKLVLSEIVDDVVTEFMF